MPTKNITFPELIQQFGSEDACHEALEELRWPDGVRCPRCEEAGRRADRISRIKKRRQFHCDECSYQFSVRVGTIFEDSHLPLWKWFLTVYMMVQSKKGISANQLKRMLEVSYKTAWYLCHRIRKAMEDEDAEPLRGIVELDHTFIGGKRRGIGGGRYRDHKSIVATAVERGGSARLRVMKNEGKRGFHKFVKDTVHDDAKAIFTDEHGSYGGINDKNTIHETVTHSEGEYAKPSRWLHAKVHSNTAEGVFSLLERSIFGAYHKVSKKHLPAYLYEVEWRYNNRQNPYLFRDTLLELVGAKQLTYNSLVSSQPA